jgi:hypothetical protein
MDIGTLSFMLKNVPDFSYEFEWWFEYEEKNN